MKKLYPFDKFIGEGVKDLMTPKSEEDIKNSLKNISVEEKLLKGCLYGYMWLVAEAIEAGVDINFLNIAGVGALQIASYNGHIDIVKLLLNKGIDLNKIEIVTEFRPKPVLNVGQSALREASVRGHEEIIQLLLDNGVYPNHENWDWHSRTYITPYIYRLLNKYKKTNEGVKDLMTPKSKEEICRDLKNAPYRDIMNHLMDGVADNDEEKVEMMFRLINKDFQYCLEMSETAINYGNIRIIKMFLDKGMPDDVLWHLFDYAYERKKYDISDLIKNYIYINESVRDKMTPKSEEDIKKIAKGYMDRIKSSLDTYPMKIWSSTEQVCKYLGEERKNLYFIPDESEYYESLDEYFSSLVSQEQPLVKKVKDWYCYPSLKLAYWEDHYDPESWTSAWVFSKNNFMNDKNYFGLDEGIRDMMTPKSKDEFSNKYKNLSPQEKFVKGIKNGVLWLVKDGFENGANPKERLGDSQTPLTHATTENYLDVVKYLIEICKVNPEQQWCGNTPLKWAIIYGHRDIVEYLKSINVNESVRDKMTPKSEEDIMNYLEELTQEELDLLFVKSVCEQQIPMIKATLRMGANPNSKDPHGLTALYRAVQGSITTTPSLEVIKLLLDNGANPMLASKKGFIPLRHAETWGKPEIVELLKKYVKTNESIRDKMTPKSDVDIRKYIKKLPAKKVLSFNREYGLELSDSEIKELVKKLSPKDVLTSPKEYGIKLSDEEKSNAMKKLKVGDYNELVHDEMRFGGIKRTNKRSNPAEWTVIEKRLKELKSPYDTAEEILNMREDQQLKELGYDIDTMIPLAKFYTGINYGFLWLIQQGLDSGEVNIDSLNGHALDVAVTKGDEEMVELLLRNGASVDKRDYLHINQQKHRNKKIEELLNQYGL